ncbi:MAG: O-antigen ligase family protein [Candidatus Omnitrophica bacterium]|nr:O-antigen ligase family protein [Candidatus Omnitrophota bacterium]
MFSQSKKLLSVIWAIILLFVFVRPFLSVHAYLLGGVWYISSFIVSASLFIVLCGISSVLNKRNLLVFLFWICIVISIIFSPAGPNHLSELYLFAPNIFILFAASIAHGRKKQLITVMMSAAVIISIFALMQYFWVYDEIIAQMKKTNIPVHMIPEYILQKRVFATFLSPNIFATYSGMMVNIGIAVLICAYMKKRARIFIWGMAFSVIIMTAALFLTQSAAGIMAACAGMAVFVFYLIFIIGPYKGLKKSKRFGLYALFCGVLAAGIISVVMITEPGIINFKDPHNGFVQRFYYWLTSIKMIGDSPWTGIGWRSMGDLYGGYKPAAANISHYSHNVFLQILLETGPVGLILFLGIIILFFHRAHNVIKRDGADQILNAGLLSAAVVFLVHNCFDISFYFVQVSFFWWLILGLF